MDSETSREFLGLENPITHGTHRVSINPIGGVGGTSGSDDNIIGPEHIEACNRTERRKKRAKQRRAEIYRERWSQMIYPEIGHIYKPIFRPESTIGIEHQCNEYGMNAACAYETIERGDVTSVKYHMARAVIATYNHYREQRLTLHHPNPLDIDMIRNDPKEARRYIMETDVSIRKGFYMSWEMIKLLKSTGDIDGVLADSILKVKRTKSINLIRRNQAIKALVGGTLIHLCDTPLVAAESYIEIMPEHHQSINLVVNAIALIMAVVYAISTFKSVPRLITLILSLMTLELIIPDILALLYKHYEDENHKLAIMRNVIGVGVPASISLFLVAFTSRGQTIYAYVDQNIYRRYLRIDNTQ